MQTQMNIKLDKDLKDSVERILNRLGLNMGDAIRVFLSKVRQEQGIPFELKLSKEEQEAQWEYELQYGELSETNRQVIEDIKHHRNLTSYNSAEEMFADLGIKNTGAK